MPFEKHVYIYARQSLIERGYLLLISPDSLGLLTLRTLEQITTRVRTYHDHVPYSLYGSRTGIRGSLPPCLSDGLMWRCRVESGGP